MELFMLKRPEVEKRTSLARATIYAKIKIGQFPPPRRLGGKNVAWRSDEIEAWLNAREPSLKPKI